MAENSTEEEDDKDFLTSAQAARLFSVTQRTITRWLCEEKIPGGKVGDRWRLPKERIGDILRRQREESEKTLRTD